MFWCDVSKIKCFMSNSLKTFFFQMIAFCLHANHVILLKERKPMSWLLEIKAEKCIRQI